ncbi:MAG: copper-translocating P-type ATPase [bacterium]
MDKQHQEHHKQSHHHQDHHKMMIRDFRKRFWVSLSLTLPILVLSPMIQGLLHYDVPFPGNIAQYVLFGLSTFVFFYGGWPFLKGLVDEWKDKRPGMMTLIAVAISVAWGYSSLTTFGMEGKKFFWELATLVDVMLLGHWIEMKSVLGASRSVEKLVEMMPSEAHLLKDDEVEDVPVDQLKADDKVLVKPGEKIPADGKIADGKSEVNQAMVTGESKPVVKTADDEVIGGTINGNGTLKVVVKGVGEEAYLNKVIQMVEKAREEKSKTQKLADRIAFWLTITALSIGFGTLAAWLLLDKPFVFALERMASVMVITCPHALGLAVPLVVAISTSLSAERGLLIRNRTAFEQARKINTLIFDKTGTLTKGNFGVTEIKSFHDDYDENDILHYAGALESNSEHPIAAGILRKAEEKNISIPEAKNFNAITGKGVEADVEGKKVKITSPDYLEELDVEVPDKSFLNGQDTVVIVLINGEVAGSIVLSDEIREESYEAVSTLQDENIRILMMTGDNHDAAQKVSDQLGLDGFYANMSPDEKLTRIRKLQDEGNYVAMTGDGINDAPALASADVGIAVGSGTDIAAETADIILVNSNPKDIASLIRFGKATHRKMIQNFVWATAYNVVAIPLGAGVLYSAGILISPALGALLMSLSTIIVAINAQLLKRKLK